MAEAETPTDVEDIALQWIQITNAVARGRLAPEEGVAMLKALAAAHPADREWLEEEIETIRQQFGLDVVESIRDGRGGYWDKLRSVINALLDERLDHDRALELLMLMDAQHPEHTEQTTKLISGIRESPMRRFLEEDD